MKKAFPIFALLTLVLLSYALYEALVAAPTEQTMGEVQRIFYYHVPSAWTAFLLFLVNFVASVVYLLNRSDKADILALVTAEVGVVGRGVSLDPRMTRVLLINWAACLCLALLVCWSRYRLERLKREVEETQALEALLEPKGVR